MARPSTYLPSLIAAVLVMVIAAGATVAFWLHLAPADLAPACAVRIAGIQLTDGQAVADLIGKLAHDMEQRPIRVVHPVAAVDTRRLLGELGVRVDADTTMRHALQVGRRGSWAFRLDERWRARRGEINVPLRWHIDPGPLIAMLTRDKELHDRLGSPARYDFANKTVIPHTDGSFVDAFATLDALDRLLRLGGDELRVVNTAVAPVVTAAFLGQLDISQRVGHFETRFGHLGAQASRAHNITTAAQRLDGIVLMPEQVVSFNAIVGRRTVDNGFAKGWEIFRGEMVEGVGGGACQVASTLHAAAYLAGLDVIERSPHSRPSGYIPIGLDATVVDGLVDLKLRNPFAFPLVVRSLLGPGTLTFELFGQRRPVQVAFRGDVVRTSDYRRQVREAGWLPEGRVVRKQKGIRGYVVRRTRAIRTADGTLRNEITTDTYPPTMEILLVPPGTNPDTDLPPLPFETVEGAEPGQDEVEEGDQTTSCDSCPPPVQVEDAPGASRGVPAHVPHRIIIDR
ncbi:MAG: VanW family protein [Polyangiaceae bacterium]|jgi:vancomycin resistance protein YoaR|nr:VanW family protein [Polyangiaceae bacterium]